MANKATLLIRIVRPDRSWTYTKPVFAANKRLRPLYALVNDEPEYHPEGCYYLRFMAHGVRQCRNAGSDATEALVALDHLNYDLQGLARGRDVPSLPPPPPKPVENDSTRRIRLDEAIREFLDEKERDRAHRTAIIYRQALDEFVAANTGANKVTYLDEIKGSHLKNITVHVKAKGNKPRTASGHIKCVGTFLRHFGFEGVMKREHLPRFTKKKPTAYDTEEVQKLYAAATPNDRLIFEFLLNTGFREQEAIFTEFRDVDFKSGLVHVRAKPHHSFEPKDREERSVPVPDSLLVKLKVHIEEHPGQKLLFVGPTGGPDRHMLRRLKSTALRAGLNCGLCTTRTGKGCAHHPVCKNIGLHRFRRTFATAHHEMGGASIRNLMDWLGHSDVATTMSYLAVSDKRSDRTRAMVNNSFTAFAA